MYSNYCKYGGIISISGGNGNQQLTKLVTRVGGNGNQILSKMVTNWSIWIRIYRHIYIWITVYTIIRVFLQ